MFAGDRNKWKKVVGGSGLGADFQPFSKSIFLMETEDCTAARHCSGKIMQSWIKKWPKDQTRPATVGVLSQPFPHQCIAKRQRSTIYNLFGQTGLDSGLIRWAKQRYVYGRRVWCMLGLTKDWRCTHASSFWVENTDPYCMNAGDQESANDCKFIEWILLSTAIHFALAQICISSN